MAYARAKHTDAQSIPVIDITPLRDGTNANAVAKDLHRASQELGFIYIKGHGIPDAVIKSARNSALQFFRHGAEDKSSVTISEHHRGWLGRGGAIMEDGAKPDLKESFLWGSQNAELITAMDHPLRGQNRWPAFMPDLETHAMTYFNHVQEVAAKLMQGFALALDLAPDFFLRSCSKPLSRASFVFYPSQPKEMGEDQFGVGPHTDFGVLTILCQDSVGGLQVQGLDGEWLEAPPIDGTLVVNVGDLLARWTDGIYRSTYHRVVNSSHSSRLSLVLAFDPDPETLIDARDVFGSDHISAEPPITCGNYLMWRFSKAFKYRDGQSP